ncbi:MAG TPA: alpha/beta hydrolase [Gaiellaceae bacterium]|nr:alpha/beta hydrolase [Gaiellaceae bacterium]
MRRRRPGHGHARRAAPLTVLLVAGLGQGGWVWHEVAARLAPRELVTYDNRGTGDAPGPARSTVAGLADDAAEAAGGPADVVGLSMGGYVALTLALLRPELVRSLVLVGTGAGGPDRVPRADDVQAVYREAFTLGPEEYVRRTFPLTVRPDRLDALLDENVARAVPHRTTAAHTRACLGFYADGAEVERIAVPALVIHGSDDRIVPVENGRRLAARLPDADYVELPGYGHDLAQEAPDELAALIDAFLS